MPTIDFKLADHGSIVIISPMSEQATEWVDSFISDDAQWHGDGFAVEHRFVQDIVNRLLELGMNIVPITVH